jgi:hypothetical protein
MVNFCDVKGCSNRADKDKNKSFYRLPAIIKHQGSETESLSSRRQIEWLAAINRSDIKDSNYQHARVCSDHFISGKPSLLYDSTSPDWVPSLKLGYSRYTENCGPSTSSGASLARYSRAQGRASKKQRLNEDCDVEVNVLDEVDMGPIDKEVQTGNASYEDI